MDKKNTNNAPAFDRRLAIFFTLAFAISWVFWIPAALASHGLIPLRDNSTLGSLLGAFGPFFAALFTVIAFEGRSGLIALFKRLLIWRVGIVWSVFVLFWPVLLSLATTILFTWVYNHTKGSLLLALLFHSSIAVSGLFLASAEAYPLIEVVLTWIAAVLVIGAITPKRSSAES